MSLYETVFSNLANPLTFSEESGVVAGSLGVVGTRRHQRANRARVHQRIVLVLAGVPRR
jgi:hypothetical protein